MYSCVQTGIGILAPIELLQELKKEKNIEKKTTHHLIIYTYTYAI